MATKELNPYSSPQHCEEIIEAEIVPLVAKISSEAIELTVWVSVIAVGMAVTLPQIVWPEIRELAIALLW